MTAHNQDAGLRVFFAKEQSIGSPANGPGRRGKHRAGGGDPEKGKER